MSESRIQTKVILQRRITQKRDDVVKKHIDYIVKRALGSGRGSTQGWTLIKKSFKEPIQLNGEWVFTAELCFSKMRGSRNNIVAERQWTAILDLIKKVGKSTRYQPFPWSIVDEDTLETETETELDSDLDEPEVEKKINGIKIELKNKVKDVVVPTKVMSIDDLRDRFDEEIAQFLEDNQTLQLSPYFKDIFNREPQIRCILSSIRSAIDSSFERRNHTLLHGMPACAKTQILLAIEQCLGEGSILRLDATSTTRAGLEKLFFKELEEVPPIIVIEEIEKTNEEALRIWLGALDDRGEVRKVNFHMHQVRELKVLCLATANDKVLFDNMMGGRPNYPGALSSRFVHQLECPRPDEEVLKKILIRDVNRFGGKIDWVEPSIKLAKQLETNDPRKVLGFLDGGDRLLDGSYQRDILKIYKNSQ